MGEYYGNNDWRDYKSLKHYGVKGMKWGRGRKARVIMGKNGKLLYLYNNSDGSATSRNISSGKPIRRKKKVTAGGSGVNITGKSDSAGGRVGYYFDPVKPTIRSKVGKVKYYINRSKRRFKEAGYDDPAWTSVVRVANGISQEAKNRGRASKKANTFLRRQKAKKKVLASINGLMNKRKKRS